METETHTSAPWFLPEPSSAAHTEVPCAACHPRQYAEQAKHRAVRVPVTRPVVMPSGRHTAVA